MNRLNRKIEYALMALKHMSSKVPGELTTAKEVVEAAGCPFDATARVMQQMAHKGLLKSEQGACGGYLIVKDLSRTTFFDLMEIISGPLGIVKCQNENEHCDLVNSCNIQTPTAVLNRRLEDFYRALPLSELLRVKDNMRGEAAERMTALE